jgi:hypothetical protein
MAAPKRGHVLLSGRAFNCLASIDEKIALLSKYERGGEASREIVVCRLLAALAKAGLDAPSFEDVEITVSVRRSVRLAAP